MEFVGVKEGKKAENYAKELFHWLTASKILHLYYVPSLFLITHSSISTSKQEEPQF